MVVVTDRVAALWLTVGVTVKSPTPLPTITAYAFMPAAKAGSSVPTEVLRALRVASVLAARVMVSVYVLTVVVSSAVTLMLTTVAPVTRSTA